MEQLDGDRRYTGLLIYPAVEAEADAKDASVASSSPSNSTAAQQSSPSTGSLSRAQSSLRAQVLTGVYNHQFEVGDGRADSSSPLHPLALNDFLRWIHSSMRHGTFDLDEMLSLAALYDAAALVIARPEKLAGDFRCLANEASNWVTGFNSATADAITKLIQAVALLRGIGDIDVTALLRSAAAAAVVATLLHLHSSVGSCLLWINSQHSAGARCPRKHCYGRACVHFFSLSR